MRFDGWSFRRERTFSSEITECRLGLDKSEIVHDNPAEMAVANADKKEDDL